MDTPTARHLEAWIAKYVPEDDRERALERILAFVADYPDLLTVDAAELARLLRAASAVPGRRSGS